MIFPHCCRGRGKRLEARRDTGSWWIEDGETRVVEGSGGEAISWPQPLWESDLIRHGSVYGSGRYTRRDTGEWVELRLSTLLSDQWFTQGIWLAGDIAVISSPPRILLFNPRLMELGEVISDGRSVVAVRQE